MTGITIERLEQLVTEARTERDSLAVNFSLVRRVPNDRLVDDDGCVLDPGEERLVDLEAGTLDDNTVDGELIAVTEQDQIVHYDVASTAAIAANISSKIVLSRVHGAATSEALSPERTAGIVTSSRPSRVGLSLAGFSDSTGEVRPSGPLRGVPGGLRC